VRRIFIGLIMGLALMPAGVVTAATPAKGFKLSVAVMPQYDDNVYYSPNGTEVSTWVFTIAPELEWSKEGARSFFNIGYRGQGDLYLDTESEIPGQELDSSDIYNNYLKFNFGYRLSDHVLFRLRDNLDNTNRPDFRLVDEMVYGRFIQNDLLADLVFKTTDHVELSVGYGNTVIDYYRDDDSVDHDFINSQGHQFNAGLYYHFNTRTKAGFIYRYYDRNFPDADYMDYTDNTFGGVIERQFSDAWSLNGEIGAQDRDVDGGTWSSGTNLYYNFGVQMQRERSSLNVTVGRERSQAPNYSADFYTDYYLQGRGNWLMTARDNLFLEFGLRWNDFEVLSADDLADDREDDYQFIGVGYAREMQDRWFIESHYRFMNRGSNNADYEFGKNVFSVGVRYVIF